MKILHFSDLHLDHAFLDDPFALTGRERRESLSAILTDIVALVRSERVDIVTIAGDLFDSDTVMPATLRLLSEALGELAPIPVLVAPGQSDAYHAEALYARWDLPANVRVFNTESPTACEITPQLTIWGMVSPQSPLNNCLHDLRSSPGVNLLLAHASGEQSIRALHGAANLKYLLLGGEHCYREIEGGVYPGSPDALEQQTETCLHGVVLIDIDSCVVTVRQIDTSQWRYATAEVDLTSCTHQSDVEQLIQSAIDADGDEHCLHNIVLTGEPHCDIRLDQLQNRLRGHVAFTMRLRLPNDLESIAAEPTVRGLFFSRFIERLASTPSGERASLLNALQLGQQALEGIELPYNAVDPD